MCLLLLRLYTSSLPIVRVEKPFSEYFKVLRVLSAAAYSGNKPAEHREREIELEEKQKFTLGRCSFSNLKKRFRKREVTETFFFFLLSIESLLSSLSLSLSSLSLLSL